MFPVVGKWSHGTDKVIDAMFFQGSENETIVYVVGESWHQTWKHIYTAVTRGQKRVYVVSKEKGVESAIRKREIPRNTRLGGLVKDQLVDPTMLLGTPQARPNTPQGTPSSCRRPQVTTTRSKTNICKRLWKADGQEEAGPSADGVFGFSAANSSSAQSTEQRDACEEMEEVKPSHSAAKKRILCAENLEAPFKQP